MTTQSTGAGRSLSPTGLCLAVLHLLACVAVVAGESFSRGEWSPWFYVFLLDFPASMVALALPVIPQSMSLAVVGTIWWYILGHSVTLLVGRTRAEAHRR